MYPGVVFLFTIGCVGVFGQLELSTVVPKGIPFNTTFKVDFDVNTYKVIGGSAISECTNSNADNVCYSGKKPDKLLELHVTGVPADANRIYFKDSGATKEKIYTLSTKATAGDNIIFDGGKIDETSLTIGFPVEGVKFYTESAIIRVEATPECNIDGTVNCVKKADPTDIRISVPDDTPRTLVCTATPPDIKKKILNVTPVGKVLKKQAEVLGFTPHECTARIITEHNIEIKNKPGNCVKGEENCFENKVSTTITVSSKAITENLVISLGDGRKSQKATFQPIECRGAVRVFNAAGIIGASWIITMQL